MTRTITLVGENGAPMQEGLVAELLRDGQVIAQSKIDASGTASFNVQEAGPFRLRVTIPPEAMPRDGGEEPR